MFVNFFGFYLTDKNEFESITKNYKLPVVKLSKLVEEIRNEKNALVLELYDKEMTHMYKTLDYEQLKLDLGKAQDEVKQLNSTVAGLEKLLASERAYSGQLKLAYQQLEDNLLEERDILIEDYYELEDSLLEERDNLLQDVSDLEDLVLKSVFKFIDYDPNYNLTNCG